MKQQPTKKYNDIMILLILKLNLLLFYILVCDKQHFQSHTEQVESNNSGNSQESEPFLLRKKFSALNNYTISKGLFNICEPDSEQVANNNNVIVDPDKSCSNDNSFDICGSDSEQVVKNYNVIVDPGKSSSNNNLFETEINGLLSHEMEQYSITDLMNKFSEIGHIVREVATKNMAIERELKIIKLDVIKNQELLIALTNKSTTGVTAVHASDTAPINRINLKIPIQTLDDLNAIDADEEKLGALANILQRNSKSFDTRRTAYFAMKITIHNRFAETLNMEGRRGEKIAFGKYKVSTTIIDCEFKELHPDSTIIEIKNYISDWLKQAPRRK